ncbi:MAG: M67 family metallopeptidase [Planctomycetota bacterium]
MTAGVEEREREAGARTDAPRADERAPHDAPRSLELDPSVLARLARMTRRHAPAEACGLLLGRSSDVVLRAVRCRNRAADPRRAFEVDAGHWVRWELWAARRGLSVVGVWHSHPEGPARPSRADVLGAPDGLWSLIVAPAPDVPQGAPAALHASHCGRMLPRCVTIRARTPIGTERDGASRASIRHPLCARARPALRPAEPHHGPGSELRGPFSPLLSLPSSR